MEFPLPIIDELQPPARHFHGVFCNSGIMVSVTDCPAQMVVAVALIASVRSTVFVVVLVLTAGLKSKTIFEVLLMTVPCGRFALLWIWNETKPWLRGSSVDESGRRMLLK